MSLAGKRQYSAVAILLHWLIATALLFQISLGLGLETLAERGFALTQLHKSVGISILVLSLLRLGWRVLHPPPPAPETGLAGLLSKGVHVALYGFMIAGPLTGWLLVSAAKIRIPTLIFGIVPLPHLPIPTSMEGITHVLHAMVSWIGLALVLLHVAGALRHLLLLRDGSMQAMAPRRSLILLWLLFALPVLGWLLAVMMVVQARAPVPAPAVPAPAEAVPAPVSAPPDNVAAPAEPAPQPDQAAVPAKQDAPPPEWTIRPGGSLSFSIGNGAETIQGRFTRWRGQIRFDPDAPETADIRITVDLASAALDDATQETMLHGPDFLDVETFTTAVYHANSARLTGANRYAATGSLDLKGHRQPVKIAFSLSGTGAVRKVDGQATLDRTAFDIGGGEAAALLSPNVDVRFSFEASH